MASNIPCAPGTLGPPRQLLKELLKPWSNEKVPINGGHVMSGLSTSTLWMNHDEPGWSSRWIRWSDAFQSERLQRLKCWESRLPPGPQRFQWLYVELGLASRNGNMLAMDNGWTFAQLWKCSACGLLPWVGLVRRSLSWMRRN